MNLLEKIIDKIQITFVSKGNSKKITKLKNTETQVYQEKGITHVYKCENLTINNIQELAGFGDIQDSNNLLKNAGQRFLIEQNTKQRNFKMAVDKAELNTISKPQELEQDWFLKWMSVSQEVSRENVQNILARILSTEVQRSGAFSLRTLEILKNISKNELQLFQKFCDISFNIPQLNNALCCVVCEPFESPGNNGLITLELPYPNLMILQDAGLIQTELNAWREFKIPHIFQIPFTIGAKKFLFKSTEETVESQPHVKVINFTVAGLELRSVLDLNFSEKYNNKFIEWVADKYKMNSIE